MPLPKFAEVISKTRSNNVMVGLIGAIKGKRNADVPMKTLVNHMIIAILPLVAVALLMVPIYYLMTFPTAVDTTGLQEMGTMADEERAAEADTKGSEQGGLQEPQEAGGLQEPPAEVDQGAPAAGTPAAESAKAPPAEVKPAAPIPAAAAKPGRTPAPLSYWITLGIFAAGLAVFYVHFYLRAARDLQDAPGVVLPAGPYHPRGARHHRRRCGDADRGGGDGIVRRFRPGGRLQTTQLPGGQGIGLPHREDLGHGLLALRRIEPFRRGVRAPRRAGGRQCSGCYRSI